MNWYRTARYFTIDTENDMGEFEEQTGMDPYDAQEQAQNVFNNTQINTRKNIREVVMPDNEDRVIGTLAEDWERIDGEADKPIYEYSFDLSVLKDFQKQGAGRQLIENALKRYNSEKAAYEEMDCYTRIKIWAVNANVARVLEEGYGFDFEPVAYSKGEPVQWYCYKY